MKKFLILTTFSSFLYFGLNQVSFAGCSEPHCRSSDCPKGQVCRTPNNGGCRCVLKNSKPTSSDDDSIPLDDGIPSDDSIPVSE